MSFLVEVEMKVLSEGSNMHGFAVEAFSLFYVNHRLYNGVNRQL